MTQLRDNNQQARFKDAPWFPKNQEAVFVGGAGGIGSWVTFFLTKMGFNAYLYDFDTIEEHNLGGQLFRQSDLGSPKVNAVAKMVEDFCSGNISYFNQAVTPESMKHHFCFSAFDNMKARRILFDNWKASWSQTYMPETLPIFIDGRLEMESFQIFCVTPATAYQYEEFLFSDNLVDEAPCTMKQSSHTAAMIGSMMALFFTNHIANVYEGDNIREVPFYYEFVGPMNHTITR